MATLMNIGAALGRGTLILGVIETAAKPVAVNTTTAGWSIRSEITESQVADFRRTCKPQIAACSPVRRVKSLYRAVEKLAKPNGTKGVRGDQKVKNVNEQIH
jgi:hypothetical protein